MERFQTSLHHTLTKEAANRKEVWLWHPPDGMGLWRPGDWLFGAGGVWGCIEAKQTRTHTLPQSDWKPQQRQACRNILDAGGAYWLVVCFEFGGQNMLAVAYFGTIALELMDAYKNLDHRRDLPKRRLQFGLKTLFWHQGDWENAYAMFSRPQRAEANWRQSL